MESDGNSSGGDVVLESVNMASRDEDSILYQIYEKQIFSNFSYEELKMTRENIKIKIRTYLLFIYWV